MKWTATNHITLTDPYLVNAEQKLLDYLLSFDEDKLLYEFYQVAQLEAPTSTGYQGWERSDLINFRGHFPGHYLSAAALAFKASDDQAIQNKLEQKLENMVKQLGHIQEAYAAINPASAGYLSAFTEASLDAVEGIPAPANQAENNLVPWYILHKVLAGLLDVHEVFIQKNDALSQLALEIATRFGDYIYKRMMRLKDKQLMLQIEYGGMNDALYRLFTFSKNPNHHTAATYFDEVELFKALARGEDVLAGKHANTMIPKFLGALSHYETTENPEEMYLTAAINFWDIVINHHTYATGGNSQSEHFHLADELYHDAAIRVGDCTCETCNTHNMLKLTRRLYQLTHDSKYLDYYERTYINAILASQNPETGMMMYFQPMDAGYNKVYNRPYDEFWCCTGTGIESFAKLSDTFYFSDEDTLFINSYFSNQLHLAKANLLLNLQSNADFSQINITATAIDSNQPILIQELAFRIPNWSQKTRIEVDGQGQEVSNEADFIFVALGKEIQLSFDPQLQFEATPDNPNYGALVYGPFVLASRLGNEAMDADNPNGILVRVGTKLDYLETDIIVEKEDWLSDIKPIESEKYSMAFELKASNQHVEFVPYYQIHDERYGIYHLYLTAANNKQKNGKSDQIVDSLNNFDHNNSEFAKGLEFNHSFIATKEGKNYRIAEDNGWFAYDFGKLKSPVNKVRFVFHQEDLNKELQLTINDKRYSIAVEGLNAEVFIEKEIEIEEAGELSIRFGAGVGIFGIYLLG
ncbi:glycoside hydrolase family 127 protein [Fundicoccus sp. Sow4_H7]|uniref:glycoside hydrolase family 127 protein n=1 Tax=Fundicoccus sp. Sow4_H7 TaxID=3438784 RepID=UPI003F8F77BA